MKIRNRVILVIISTNFMIILLSILAGTGYVREKVEEYIEADMMVVADIADRFISAELDLLRYEAGAAADRLDGTETADLASVLAEQLDIYTKFAGMSVLDRNGKIAASAGEAATAPNLQENEAILKAFSGETAFSSTTETGNGVVFYLAVPIPGTKERILVLTLDGMYFSDLASEYHVWDTGHIFIDDSEGYVIANIRPEWVQNRQNFVLLARDDSQYEPVATVIEKLIAGGRGIDYYSIDGIARICAYRPVSGSAEGWCLGIVAPLSESPVKDVDRGLFIIAIVCFLLNIAAAVVASNFIRKPFENLAALREAAEDGSRAKSTFLAQMSHEIRTPLNAVVGLSELALGDGKLEQEMADRLEKIRSSGMTILSIVNDILDISKIESGKLELNPVRYDTPSLINDIVTLNVVRIGEKPVVFKLHVDEDMPGALFGDDLRIKQIFNNLLSNAFKYTDSGTVEWRISSERNGDEVWLVSSVSDTGIGIRPDDIKKLFSDYNQLNLETNRKIEGTGLGLAITKRLVEMMGGTIGVESEYGKGSVFKIRVKQIISTENPIGREVAGNLMNLRYTLDKRSGDAKLLRADMSYAHVLVVDDIATNLDVIKGMLKPYRLNINCAMSGPQTIGMIRAENPRYDAVFMDHMMPGMDGIEATRIIRNEIGTDYARNIPIIALTANAIVGNEEMFLNRGFQGFISKPIDIAKLDAVLRRFVRNKTLEKQLSGTDDEENGFAAGVSSGDGQAVFAGISVDGVDVDKALERFSGDKTVLIDVLRSYATNTRPLLNALKHFMEAENLEEYATVVHGIKGASYGIFAQEAGAAAEALETAARAGDADTVKSGCIAFENLIKTLLDAIERALDEIGAVQDKPICAGPDPKLLSELREAAGSFDMDRVDSIMARLETFRYESGGEIIDWLRKRVDDMLFEEISHAEWPS